jgi:hypothetical protein
LDVYLAEKRADYWGDGTAVGRVVSMAELSVAEMDLSTADSTAVYSADFWADSKVAKKVARLVAPKDV